MTNSGEVVQVKKHSQETFLNSQECFLSPNKLFNETFWENRDAENRYEGFKIDFG